MHGEDKELSQGHAINSWADMQADVQNYLTVRFMFFILDCLLFQEVRDTIKKTNQPTKTRVFPVGAGFMKAFKLK